MNHRFVNLSIIIIHLFVINIINAQDGITLNAKVFLSGCYLDGEMRTDLLDLDLIPKSQPFNNSVWNYNGLESVSNIPSNIVDWLLIELRSDLTTKIAQKVGFLRNDGKIVDLDGVSNLAFSSLPSSNYYIIVYHNNHLPIMSSTKTLLNDNPPLYDFTDSQLKAYGFNSLRDLGDGKFAMIAGDGDQSGIVNNLDYGTVANNIFKSTYITGDLDMSGFVNVMDYSLVYSNILKSSSIPNEISNIRAEPDYIVNSFEELKSAVANAEVGSILQIENDIEFPVSGFENPTYGEAIIIDKNLVIQGKSYVDRPKLWNADSSKSICLFSVKNANVTFRNLKFDGTDGIEGSKRNGVRVGGYYKSSASFPNSFLSVDSCEITGFWHGGISVLHGAVAEIKYSHIHRNRGYGLGYGILLSYGAGMVVHHSVLDSNRHHIAASGHPDEWYEAYENDVYETINGSQHAFDMHSAAGITGYSLTDGRAGNYISIHNNRFHSSLDKKGYHAIKIRGKPVTGCYIYDNVFDQITMFPRTDNWSGRAFYQEYQANGVKRFGNMFVSNNTFNNHGIDQPYDYTNLEIKFTNGEWIKMVPFGLSENYVSYPIDSLLFGDFNGDGCTDVVAGYFEGNIYRFGNEPDLGDTSLWISYGAITYWELLNIDRKDISLLDVADVNGDGVSDLIFNETTWSDSGLTTFVSLPQPFNTYTLYTERDFDADGVDEKFRISIE